MSSHPLDAFYDMFKQYTWASMSCRVWSCFFLFVAFIITSAAPPVLGHTYNDFGGLVGQLTCAVLCWLYLSVIIVSKFITLPAMKVDYFGDLPATVRFGLDLTFCMVCFIGAISGAASINSDCILPEGLCYKCPATDQLDPAVTDPACRLQGGTPVGPYLCQKTCLHAFRSTIVNEGNGGTFGFASFLMFISFFSLAFSTLLTFGEVRKGGSGFEDVGDTYGPIGGGSGYGDETGGSSSQGVTYSTEDALPPANTHDL